MQDAITYKGYSGCVEYDARDDVLHGRIMGIQDVITYEGASIQALRRDFENAVDDYLDTCEELGKTPETPFSGKFVLRVSRDLHADMAHMARQRGQSLNAMIVETLQDAVMGSHHRIGKRTARRGEFISHRRRPGRTHRKITTK